jgi:hypothetical protein
VLVDEAVDEASSFTDDGDNITSGEAATIAATNAAAADVTVVDLNHFTLFDGMVELVVEPDDEETFLGSLDENMDLLVDGLEHPGKPLLVVVQDGSGNNRAIVGHVPNGDGSSDTEAFSLGIAWQADGLDDILGQDTGVEVGGGAPGGFQGPGAVTVTAEASGTPVIGKGVSARPEVLSLDTPAGTTIFAGMRGESYVAGNPGTGQLPQYGMVEMGWIKSDGAIGFDLGADGPVTAGPCIEDDDTVEGILVGWQDVDTGIYECVYAATPGGVTWGSDKLMAIRNKTNANGTCGLECGWHFRFDSACYYPASFCEQGGITLDFKEAEFKLITEYYGTTPTTFDVEYGDSGGGGGFYRGFVIQPGTNPAGADDQVDEAQVDVYDADPGDWTTHSFTYYSGTDRNYTLMNLDG